MLIFCKTQFHNNSEIFPTQTTLILKNEYISILTEQD